MSWEGVLAIVGVIGLVANLLATMASRVRREGITTGRFEALEQRTADSEKDIIRIDAKTVHNEKNIAVLFERTNNLHRPGGE